jgi:uncharacterized protein (TIGR04255 family)
LNLTRPQLPDFKRPPVTEVALSMQFETLRGLRAIHLGSLWDKLDRIRFPKVEEQPAVPKSVERFGSSTALGPPRFEFLNLPPLPRYFFISNDETEVVQVQPDRFTFNWRKRSPDDEYPRYEQVVGKFEELARVFELFLAEQRLGTIVIEQAEITYVNEIAGKSASTRMEAVLSVFSGAYTTNYLPPPEQVNVALMFPVESAGKQVGRLYVNSAASTNPDAPGMQLTLIARGKLAGTDIKAAVEFCGLGRAAIVNGFASITSKEMHKAWERTDDADYQK